MGAAKTHDFPGLHYQPSYNSISSNRSTSSAAGGLGNDSSNASRNSLIPRDSASPVPRHIPTEDDALISETAAALSSSRVEIRLDRLVFREASPTVVVTVRQSAIPLEMPLLIPYHLHQYLPFVAMALAIAVTSLISETVIPSEAKRRLATRFCLCLQ